ncbi:MAG TPA: hydantoinase B/oxoprolinase family protein, partial [Chthoniobacterales bacterium]
MVESVKLILIAPLFVIAVALNVPAVPPVPILSWPAPAIRTPCALTVPPFSTVMEPVEISKDYTGSDDRQELQAWSTYGNTRGYTVAQVAAMMDPEIPKNEGFFNSIALIVPEGCVLNPLPGRPVSAGTHHPGADIGEVIAVALSGVLPDRAVPQTYKTGIPTIIRGVDPRTGAEFIDSSAEVYAGWCNAAKGM